MSAHRNSYSGIHAIGTSAYTLNKTDYMAITYLRTLMLQIASLATASIQGPHSIKLRNFPSSSYIYGVDDIEDLTSLANATSRIPVTCTA